MTANRDALVFRAGRRAYDIIKSQGFSPELIGSMVGASGGAKWLVLSQIDRVLARRVLPALRSPVFLLGSSIGAWRFACYAQADPLAALGRFEAAYLDQRYSDDPDIEEITATSRAILEGVLGPSGAQEILSHPTLRLSIMTVRSRHLLASERRPVLMTGLIMAMAANVVSRRALGGFFGRGLFFDPRDVPHFYDIDEFPIDRVPLSAANLADAVVASGSIPLVLNGVRNIQDAPAGTYRDGGVIDYHLDLPQAPAGKIALFPHFFDWLKPGWFDKPLRWRTVREQSVENTLLIAPSAAFIQSLPGRKVPDRSDFVKLPTEERVSRWREVVARCRELADDLEETLERGDLPRRVEPLTVGT